jgi:hypothetical protein
MYIERIPQELSCCWVTDYKLGWGLRHHLSILCCGNTVAQPTLIVSLLLLLVIMIMLSEVSCMDDMTSMTVIYTCESYCESQQFPIDFVEHFFSKSGYIYQDNRMLKYCNFWSRVNAMKESNLPVLRFKGVNVFKSMRYSKVFWY